MILQKILFPNENICREEKLYFRKEGCIISEDVITDIEKMIKRQKEDETSENLKTAENTFIGDILRGGLAEVSYHDTDLKTVELTDIYEISSKAATLPAVIFFEKNQILSIDTYFNSFSIFKWKKYTKLSNLSISLSLIGDFKIELLNVVRHETENVVSEIWSEEVSFPAKNEKILQIPIEELVTGLVYVKLTSLSDIGAFFGGAYITEIEEESTISPVKIAIAMCTYKREKYVEKNVIELSRFLMDNKESPLHRNLELYIADNSKTLDIEKLSSESVHIYPNKNLGGAGGFGRAMYEILKVKEEKDFTNIIMMDDDVKFDPNVFERLFAFLSLLKDEYIEAHIGGAMLELDNMWLQSEVAGYWYPTGHTPIKYRYDLRALKWILKNEMEDTVNFTSWWFSCMPISVLRSDNFPLPIFIKRDDIEHSLRNGKIFISLNGISIWHESFEAKKAPFLDYYYYRNMLILNARHRESFNVMSMLDFFEKIRGSIDDAVNLYRYKEAHLMLKGIDDFLKGIDWLKAQDAERLNDVILNRLSYKPTTMNDINYRFIHGVLERSFSFKETKEQEQYRRDSDNGWNEPAIKNIVMAPIKNPHPGLVCGASKVIYYDEATQKGYVTYRSHTQRDAVYEHYEMTRKALIENYDRVRKEYNERFSELIDIKFWEDYLFGENKKMDIPVEWWEKVSDISESRRVAAKERLEQYKLEAKEQEKRIPEYPIVKNRVVFYLYKRRGFTCNVKYIMKKLHELAGDKIEIIWVSDYPETCEEVEKMGIPVIKAGTKKHWEYYFTARVNITSDCQPAYFIKRDDQVAITAWHGGISYKIIGYDCLGYSTDEEIELYGMSNKQPDYWLSGSERFTKDTAMGFKHDINTFIPTGMARNDVFFTDQTELIDEVRKKLGIADGVKIAMYAPTFRRGGKAGKQVFDLKKFKAALVQRWGGEWMILYRGHYFIKNNPNLDALDVSQYDDMQELLLITDVLVSDYSSVMWDFTFTGRPTFVYAPDLDEYLYGDRGFFIPVEEWPYPIATNSIELCENVVNFDETGYETNIAMHHKTEGSFENGNSAEAACNIIIEACSVKKTKMTN